MKKVLNNNFVRFLIVGTVNTLIGYGVFYLLLTYCDAQAYLANSAGYMVALIVAFLLSKTFVFESKYTHQMVPRFILAFLVAFFINQLVLLSLIQRFQIIPEFAQVVAMSVYTIIFYFLNKKFVFRS